MSDETPDLVSRYATTVELVHKSVGKYARVFPETILPAPKAEIAAALQVDLAKETDPIARELLKTVYVMLADFVPAEDWIVCWRVMERIISYELANKIRSQVPLSDAEWSQYMKLAATVPDEDFRKQQVVQERQQMEMKERLREMQQYD
jgi:hypothetical protein